MKFHKVFGLLVIAALLSTALVVPAVAQEPAQDVAAVIEEVENWVPAEPMQPFKIGIVVKVLVNDPFQLALADSAKKTVEELGGEGIVLAAPTHSDVAEQVAIVEDLVEQKVDGLLLVPLGSDAIVPAVEKANEAGIPVVIADTASYGGDFVTFLATDNIKASSMAAEYLIDKFGGTAKVAQLEGEPGGQTAADRIKGFQDKLAEVEGMELVASQTGHWSTAGGQATMENIIQANPDLNAVFASSDMMGVGAAEAIGAAGKTGEITLVTFDGLPEGVTLIKQGASDADVAQFPVRMGTWGAKILGMIISGAKTSADFPKYIDTGAEVVTAETADTYLCNTFGQCAGVAAAEAPVVDTNWTPAAPIEGSVGIIVRTMVNDPFQVAMAESAQKKAEALGLKPLVYAPTGHADVQEQQAIVEDLIQQNVNGILLAPLDTEALKVAMESAAAANIPVVLFDSNPIEGAPFVTAIGTNNVAAASIAADYLIEKFGGTAKVAQIEGEPGAQNALFRVQGFQERLKEAPGMELVASQTGHWTTAGAMQATENIIQAHPDVNAIFASSDMMGVGAVEALQAAGRMEDVTLVTFDGIPEGIALIKQGASDGDVAQYPTKMGEMGIVVLAQLIAGEKTAADFPQYIDSGAELVTPETADAFLLNTFGIEPAQ